MASVSNLPLQLTSFVGRGREVALVNQVLKSQARLVTLTGPGGIGKSRLALRVAHELAEDFADGTWLVELAALGEPSLVPHAVAAALDIRERPDVLIREALVDSLSDKHLLIILDNCEHLLSGCAELVHDVLRRCATITVLATSRQSLGVAGEVAWPVPPLSLPDRHTLPGTDELAGYEAVSLFLERAHLVVPELRLGDRNASTIVHICRQLDGIPLALELAAARTRSLGLEQIAARLDDRFKLLTGGARGTLERHQTLHGTVEWSYELLAEAERSLFRRLGVFAGGWSLEAAESICRLDGHEVLELLTQLVDKSLVLVDGHDRQARYRLLETLRQFALDKAARAGELDQTRDRHLAWFVQLVEQADAALRGPDQSSRLEVLDQEHDNIRAALGWALEAGQADSAMSMARTRPDPNQRQEGAVEAAERRALGLRLAVGCAYFWQIRGHRYRAEARRWLEQLLEVDAPSNPVLDRLRARALNWAATFAAELADPHAAAELFAAARDLCERVGDQRQLVEVQLGLGMLRRLQGEYAEAESLLGQSLVLVRELGDPLGQARVLRQLGALARDTGDPARADACSSESLAILLRLGESHQAGHLLAQVGEAARDLGQFTRSLEAHQRAIDLLEAAGCEEGVKSTLSHLAQLALARGERASAFALCLDSLRREHEIGMKRDVATCLDILAILCAADDPRRACRLLGAALAVRESMGSIRAPADAPQVEQAELLIRRSLSAPEWASEFAAGHGLPVHQAVLFALESTPPALKEAIDPLSQREREVATLIGRGLSNREISDALVLSVRTIEAHVGHVLNKLALRSRAQIAVWAVEHGLLDSEPDRLVR